jgi:hypothetical protein
MHRLDKLKAGRHFRRPLPKIVRKTMPIEISVVVGSDFNNPTLTATGRDAQLITQEERETFGVTDEPLLKAIGLFRGRVPDQVHLRNHRFFDQYQWTKTHRVLEPTSIEVVSLEMQPVALATSRYENLRGSQPVTYSGSLSYAGVVTASTNWSQLSKLSLTQKFIYKIGVPGTEIGGETHLGFEASYGTSASQTRTTTITTANAISLVVDPGCRAKAVLSARKGVLKVKVTYRAYLEGDAYYDYSDTHEDHHRWATPIESLMEAGGISNSQYVSEVLEIGFYADGRVTVSDEDKGDEMSVTPATLTMD